MSRVRIGGADRSCLSGAYTDTEGDVEKGN